MMRYPRRLSVLIEPLLPWLILGILVLFTYAFFFAVPYIGFRYHITGQVVELYVEPAPQADLRLYDQLVQVGPVLWDDFSRDFGLTLFDGVEPGDVVPLVIERDGDTLTVPWIFPGRNWNEFVQRLNSDWFLGYFFWLAGTVVLLSVRPRDVRRSLLIAFYYTTALWLITGSGASSAHVWGTAIVLQSAVWLSVPVYWHLHWHIPQPLGRLPKNVWWILYGIAGVLAVAPWFGLIPPRLYQYGLLLAVVGAIALLLLHFFFRPSQRKDLRVLMFFAVFAIVPLVAVSIAELLGAALPFFLAGATLLALPLLPAGYFYAAYRRQMGGMELRRNRLFSLYLFVIVLGSALIIVYALASVWLSFSGDVLFIGVIVSLLTALAAIASYAPFQRFVERRLLGVPPAPTHLLETYAARIATRIERSSLVDLLRDQILPGLLVSQSVLLSLDQAGHMTVLYQTGINDDDFPEEKDILALLDEAGEYRPLAAAEDSCAWIRLALVLRVSDRAIGLWLLGHRDPDDEYARSEITVLQALADQTAIALAHINQSDLLRTAYKADIDRMETERASLGRELHDHTLGDLAELKRIAEMHTLSPEFLEIYNRIATSLRQTIIGLRPAMLDYGLWAALDSLVELLADRAQDGLAIELDVAETEVRFDAGFEQHLYRIVQQACENVVRHAQAQRLLIHGYLESNRLDLTVEDDGIGLATDGVLDLSGLLAHRHFGLAGMYERAELIQAQLLVDSVRGQGTRIRVTWPLPKGHVR